jgi:hypothetical protein
MHTAMAIHNGPQAKSADDHLDSFEIQGTGLDLDDQTGLVRFRPGLRYTFSFRSKFWAEFSPTFSVPLFHLHNAKSSPFASTGPKGSLTGHFEMDCLCNTTTDNSSGMADHGTRFRVRIRSHEMQQLRKWHLEGHGMDEALKAYSSNAMKRPFTYWRSLDGHLSHFVFDREEPERIRRLKRSLLSLLMLSSPPNPANETQTQYSTTESDGFNTYDSNYTITSDREWCGVNVDSSEKVIGAAKWTIRRQSVHLDHMAGVEVRHEKGRNSSRDMLYGKTRLTGTARVSAEGTLLSSTETT